MRLLAEDLKTRTREIHQRAESHPLMHIFVPACEEPNLLTVDLYWIYLVHLRLLYGVLEDAIQKDGVVSQCIGPLLPIFARTEAIEADLVAVRKARKTAEDGNSVPISTAFQQELSRLQCLAGSVEGVLLLAHCYTRYLGDLFGGQMIARRIKQALQKDGVDAVQSLQFSTRSLDVRSETDGSVRQIPLVAAFRNMLNDVGESLDEKMYERFLEEALRSFHLSMLMFDSVLAAFMAR